MRERTYINFDLWVEAQEKGDYRARGRSHRTGEARVPVTMPFSDEELSDFLTKIGRRPRQTARGLHWPQEQEAVIQEFGGKLFDAIFRGRLRVALDTSLNTARAEGAGLRVRLRLTDCPKLADLPWEYLYDTDAHRFMALSEWTPLVRYLELPVSPQTLSVQPPLRILVMVASPTDWNRLDVDAERAKLRDALAEVENTGRVRVDRVPGGTLDDLRRQLHRADYHVFHYIGHGGYDTHSEDGVLAMEGPDRRAQLVGGADLGALLHDHRTLRLALLNSCEGARGGRTDLYSGTAQSLIRQGIPAVVAMQFEITDQAAIVFSHSLYEAVADGYPLDAAMAEARKAVKNQPNPIEWGTPVLYLRAPDGCIFDIAEPDRDGHGEHPPQRDTDTRPEDRNDHGEHPQSRRPRRRAWQRLTAGLVGLAAAGLIAVVVLQWWADRPTTWPEDGADASVTLQHPARWTPRVRGDVFTVLSPTDLRSLFASQDVATETGWPKVVEGLQSDPSEVMGVYMHEHESGFDLRDDVGQLQSDVAADLGGHRISWEGAADERVAGLPAVRLDATIHPFTSTDALSVRSYVVQLDATGPRTIHLAFFAPAPVFASHEAELDEVLDSVEVTG